MAGKGKGKRQVVEAVPLSQDRAALAEFVGVFRYFPTVEAARQARDRKGAPVKR